MSSTTNSTMGEGNSKLVNVLYKAIFAYRNDKNIFYAPFLRLHNNSNHLLCTLYLPMLVAFVPYIRGVARGDG